MKIIFINPSWTETLGSFAEIGRQRTYSPPLALCYLASSVLENGFEAEIIDAEAERLSPSVVSDIVSKKSPDIIGINVFSPTLHKSRLVAEEIKKHMPHIPIVIGGTHVTILRQEAMFECYDYGIIGEGEITIAELMRALKDRTDLSKINGLIYRKNHEVIINPDREKNENIDTIPMPAKHLLKNNLYRVGFANREEKSYTSMLAMRGCPFQCVFCSEPLIGGKKVRYRSPDRIVDEIEKDYHKLKISHFTFIDSNVTLNREQALGISEQIIKRKLPVTWEGWTRANLIDEELLCKMKKAGFIRISFGIESGDPGILKIIKKEVSLEHMRNAFRLCKKLKLEVVASAMLGLPGETRSSVNKTIEFIRNTPEIMYSNFSIAIPYPGTEMLEMAKRGEHGMKLLEHDYTKWTRYGSPGPISVNDLSSEDLVSLQKIGLLKMHFTVRRIVTSAKILNFSVLLPVFCRLLITGLKNWKLLFGFYKK